MCLIETRDYGRGVRLLCALKWWKAISFGARKAMRTNGHRKMLQKQNRSVVFYSIN